MTAAMVDPVRRKSNFIFSPWIFTPNGNNDKKAVYRKDDRAMHAI